MRRGMLLALGLFVGLVAGCGGGGDDNGIPTAGGTQPSTSASAASGDRDEQLRAFAKCMRDNGVDLPDPDPDGGFGGLLGGNSGIDRSDPKVQKAFQACQSKLPNGGEPPKLDAAQQEQFRQWAACMRENGIEVPDPNPDGTLALGELLANNKIDPSDPGFQQAMKACEDKRPQIRPGGNS